jgi:hypothetical protein
MLTTERLALFVFFILLAGFVSGYNADVFLHLAAGRYILDTDTLPHHDIFSFSAEGAPWNLHEWLYQVLLYLVYAAAGMLGLQMLTALFGVATLILVKKSCDLLVESSLATWFVLCALVLGLTLFFSPRPVLITMVLFATFFHALLQYRYRGSVKALYWLPLLMVLWVNSHGGFLIGLVLLGYFLVLQTLDDRLRQGRWCFPLPLAFTLLLSILASMLNPYGYRQLLFPFRLMEQWAVGLAVEWMPPDFGIWQYQLFLAMTMVLSASVILLGNRERFFAAGLALPFILAAFVSARHVMLAMLVMAPYLTLFLHAAFARFHVGAKASATSQRWAQQDLGEKEYLLNGIVLLLVIGLLWFIYPSYRQWLDKQERQLYPVGATTYLEAHAIGGRLFAPIQYSDYILFFRYPAIKVFYDVRLEIYGKQLTRDYLTMRTAGAGWEALMQRYDIDMVVTLASGGLYHAMAGNENYNKVYEDSDSAIFLRADKPLP